MKRIIYISLVALFILSSCKNRKNAQQETTQTAETTEVIEVKAPILEEAPKEDVIDTPEKAELGVLISLSKSVCFGECPAFTLQFFKDGTVLYEGRKSVEMIGKYKGKIDVETIHATISEATQIGFYKLNVKYDNEYVTDLPTSVTFISNKGKNKKVICRYDCDPRIIKINKAIEEMMKSVKFSKVE